MSKLEQLQTFINVIEENSFAAAARKQGISTAAISRQIAALENDLNVELLKRSTRHLSLTEIGRQYYQHCKITLNELAEAEALISQSQIEPSGELRVTSNRYFAEEYLIPHLSDFMNAFPKVIVKFEMAERFPDLIKEGIDILFGVSLEGSPDLVRRRFASTRYVMCASPSYLKKFGTPKIPQDLTRHRYITHSMRPRAKCLTFENVDEIILEPVLWLNDAEAMVECAIQGIGIVRLHDYVVQKALAKKQLVEVLPQHHKAKQPIYLYYQQSRYLQPKIRQFIDFYLQKITES